MRICCLAIMAVVLSSCGLVEIGGNGGGKHEVWTGPGQGPGGTGDEYAPPARMFFIKTGKGILVYLKVGNDIFAVPQPLIYDHSHVQALPRSGCAREKIDRHMLPPYVLQIFCRYFVLQN